MIFPVILAERGGCVARRDPANIFSVASNLQYSEECFVKLNHIAASLLQAEGGGRCAPLDELISPR
jgi:hypothetical protein